MEYVLFRGFDRVGGLYPTPEDAKQVIDGVGIWNICRVAAFGGKLRIIDRKTVVITKQ